MIYRILTIKSFESVSRILFAFFKLRIKIIHESFKHFDISSWRKIYVDFLINRVKDEHPCPFQIQLLEMHIQVPLHIRFLVQIDHIHKHFDIKLLLSGLSPHGVRIHKSLLCLSLVVMRADPVVRETGVRGFIILLLVQMDVNPVLLEGLDEPSMLLDGFGGYFVNREFGFIHELVVFDGLGV